MNKLNALNSLLLCQKYDIICITESWLGDDILDSVLTQNAPYSIVRCDRDLGKKGGGCCILIANTLHFKIVSNINIHSANIVCIDLFDIYALDPVRLINVYCPPTFKQSSNYSDFIDFLSELSTIDSFLIVVGDFNLPKIDWALNSIDKHYSSTSTEQALIDFTHQHFLTQHIHFPTRDKHILDLLFTNDHGTIAQLTPLFPFGTYFKQSDHDSFSFTVDCFDSYAAPQLPSKPTAYQFNRADYTHINKYFMSIDWIGVFSSCSVTNADTPYNSLSHINSMYDTFCDIISQAISQFVPIRPKSNMFTSLPQHIKSLYEYRIQLWNDKISDKSKFHKCNTKLNKEIEKFMKYKERKSLANIKTKFEYARTFIKPKLKQIPTLSHNNRNLYSDSEKCNAFAETFENVFNKNVLQVNDIPNRDAINLDHIVIYHQEVYKFLKNLRSVANASPDCIPEIFLKRCADSLSYPLSYLLQFIIMSKTVPDKFKKAIIVPIPKVRNSSKPTDYRPISLLCPSSKVFEKILFGEITKFFEHNNLIPKLQHGFQSKKSVVTSLIETVEDLSIAHENNYSTDIVYFDLAKAFDSVPINRLIAKLNSFGICGSLLKLIEYYLSNRSYTVKVGQRFSCEKSIPSGVPQGSIGGPILFIAYISDLPKLCNVDGVTVKLFADDLKAYCSAKNPDSIVSPLQEFIQKFTSYCEINGLSINPKKCEVLHLGNKNKIHTYSLLGNDIKSVEKDQSVRDLGLHFTFDLKWHKHIEIVTRKARRVSFAIVKSIKYSSMEQMLNLFKIYVRPILEFATNVFNPYLIKDINKLEKIQKDFLRLLYKRFNSKIFKQNPFAQLPSYEELLFINNLESLELRRLKSDLILFHKHLHGDAIISCCNPYTCRQTNTRGEKYKIIPNSCKTLIRHNSFFVRTSRIYTKLPPQIRNCNVKTFIANLHTYDHLHNFLKCKI